MASLPSGSQSWSSQSEGAWPVIRFAAVTTVHCLGYCANIGAIVVLFWAGSDLKQCAFILVAASLLASSFCVYATWLLLRRSWCHTLGIVIVVKGCVSLFLFGILQLVQCWLHWAEYVANGHDSASVTPTSSDEQHRALDSAEFSSCTLDDSSANIGNAEEAGANLADGNTTPPSLPTLGAPLVQDIRQASRLAPIGGLSPLSLPDPPREGPDPPRVRWTCKGVEGILEGATFSCVAIYTLAVKDRHIGFQTTSNVAVTLLLCLSGGFSFISTVLSLLEIDRHLSDALARRLRSRSWAFPLHFAFRASEVASRIWVLLILVTLLAQQKMPLLAFVFILLDFLSVAWVLSHQDGCEWAVPLLAMCTLVANVAHFVDSPAWLSSARRICAWVIFLRLAELVAAVILVCDPWRHPFLNISNLLQNIEHREYSFENVLLTLGPACLLIHHMLYPVVSRCLMGRADTLHKAAVRGDDRALARMLLDETVAEGPESRAARVNLRNDQGMTPLHLAAHTGSTQAVKVLVRNGAQVGARVEPTGENAVMIASAAGHHDALLQLLKHSNEQILAAQSCDTGVTALHLAAMGGHTACVHTLLRARADPNITDASGRSAQEVVAGFVGMPTTPLASSPTIDLSTNSGALDGEGLLGEDGAPSSCGTQPGQEDLLNVPMQLVPDAAMDEFLEDARQRFPNGMPSGFTSSARSSASSQLTRARRTWRTSDRRPGRPSIGLSSHVATAGSGALRYLLLEEVPSERRLPMGIEGFRIVRVIGEGNFGIVYEVRDLRSRELRGEDADRRCALKILHRKQYRVQAMQERAWQERQVLKAARHPFIVRLVCAFRTPARELALVMEYCQNGNLNSFILKCGRPGLPETTVRRILAEVLLALEYLHEDLDVVFRDLKPENVVFDGAMHAKLTDFGLAKVNATEGEGPRSFVGSTYFLAPEVTPGGLERYGPAVDLYALGLLAWVCLTGGVRMRRVGPDFDSPSRGGVGEQLVPPETHQALRTWLANRRQLENVSEEIAGAAARTGTDATSELGMTPSALSLVEILTVEDPQARGTARSVKSHSFFASGRDPVLACDDDWIALLPNSQIETASSLASSDSWTWWPRPTTQRTSH